MRRTRSPRRAATGDTRNLSRGDAPRRKRLYALFALGYLRRAAQLAPQDERVFLEGAQQLVEDVLNRRPGEPMPGLYEPGEARHG